MKGDYHRYLAEFLTGAPRQEAADSTLSSFKAAQTIYLLTTVLETLPRISLWKSWGLRNPIRLGVTLNFSVFYFEILNSYDKACPLARQAFDEVIGDLDTLGEESYKDSTLVMQLLCDNLTLWNTDLRKNSAGNELSAADRLSNTRTSH
ncbi:unnamed protein product [Spirodela intermedia]|uniref:14-3-3 domain-containing protein n=1 Tax=Spirodela intermedia TaxID=51605 RepID=A0A7I8JP71_SPIIN|nr:unnamed protein product [Spirodela intermedia]CAA6671363.1 unnamed protein product [Spirodela intermedia]